VAEIPFHAHFTFSAAAETSFSAYSHLRPRPKMIFSGNANIRQSISSSRRISGSTIAGNEKASIRPAFSQLFCLRACSFYDYKQLFKFDHRSSEVSGSIIVVSFCPFSHCVSRFLWIIKCQKLLVDLVWPVHNWHLHIIQYRYLGNAEGYCYYAGTEVAFFQCWLYIQLSFYTWKSHSTLTPLGK